MNKVILVVACLSFLVGLKCFSDEIDYADCKTIEDVITRETEEIRNIQTIDHDELAQLHASRGESYLLSAEYEKALKDFQAACSEIKMSNDVESSMFVGFRILLGAAVCYDNLGMKDDCQLAIANLQAIVKYMGCQNCLKQRPRFEISRTFGNGCQPFLRRCANDNYSDIGGPDKEPELGWCEEVVIGVGRTMDAIAILAPNPAVKIALIGVIEALIQRGLKCCQTGGFWKACVAPITRTWREWNTNKKKGIFPNAQNLNLYVK